ncbi:MAG: hypothetical protein IMF06_10875 [Proteobacteria bacterium]|nr:hypothetical protein [Pseudomonadota bacterium]
MRRLLALLCIALVAGCSSNGRQVSLAPAAEIVAWPEPIGAVTLQRAQHTVEDARIDLGLVVFDPGIPSDESTHTERGIFPKIREVESQYMPVVLREALVASDNWGVVRVLPRDDKTAELRITGKIIHSDGIDLVLHIKAIDATGHLWLDSIYHDQTGPDDYPALATEEDPYGDIYRKIANDLGNVKAQVSSPQLAGIRNVALLRYAGSLSPEAFGDFLAKDDKGEYVLRRLPSQDDPMMGRVQRIRNQEYLFIDTVDEQYVSLYEDMAPTYYLWRQYGRERAIHIEEYQRRTADRDNYGQRGSYIAMEQIYNAFKNSKIQDQDLQELAGGFNNEVAPTVMEVSGRVFRLSGGLDAQLLEWRKILRSIFALETGLPVLE